MDKKMHMLYDQDADVLYVSMGHLEYTDYEELNDNLIVRRAPKTGEIVGFTILNFAARFARQETPVALPLTMTLEQTRTRRRARTLAEPKSIYRAKQSTRKPKLTLK